MYSIYWVVNKDYNTFWVVLKCYTILSWILEIRPHSIHTSFTGAPFVLRWSICTLLMLPESLLTHFPLDKDCGHITRLLFDSGEAGRGGQIPSCLWSTWGLWGVRGAALVLTNPIWGQWKGRLMALGREVWGGSRKKGHCENEQNITSKCITTCA